MFSLCQLKDLVTDLFRKDLLITDWLLSKSRLISPVAPVMIVETGRSNHVKKAVILSLQYITII